MSDKRVSKNGKKASEDSMSMSALNEAAGWAEELMDAEWKGRKDKENLVRYRLSRKVGVSESYLFRLQYKLREMNDVRGSVYRALMLARHAYGLVSQAGENAYQEEKALADARNSKMAGLAAVVAGPQIRKEMNQ
ncbi:hypothetical protein [Mesorhizobium wenxiniae]|uniref:Uncharacterized protein n=1 Tax=Mesorhizobium wenxiniae TaxID=2014805 RepID=A0A271KE08_9HYPH|nr:hypothetical protein [Mesorhizobium wenxiniae]PAP94013.1 hypothetical protein CIT31_16740 [Mesorhizobium wenxiniae]